MGLPELAAVAATVLAATGVLPQCVRLGRTRDPEGVSLTGAMLGVATESRVGRVHGARATSGPR